MLTLLQDVDCAGQIAKHAMKLIIVFLPVSFDSCFDESACARVV
jgi:hypothetical protein